MISLVYILALLISVAIAAPGKSTPNCRCRPSDSCWPSESQWKILNETIQGNLVAVRPFYQVCHEPTYDETACKNLTLHATDSSVFLTTQPGAMQAPNWAALPSRNESCYIGTSKSVPCGQGRIPLYSAMVRQTKHIQAAVRFAKRHNLRLAIKNTGHSYLGTSTAPDSLQIFTHYMDKIHTSDQFIPFGSHKSVGSAVTIGAGVILKDLYTALGHHGLIAVAGLSPSVGAAGGYIQGGGHSPLSSLLGMAADNAIQFTVVTANGDVVIANHHKHCDLFWALRGGGGGTFGVVVDVTVRTYPDMPAYIQSFGIQTSNKTKFWSAIEAFHASLPAINDAGASGYYTLQIPNGVLPGNNTTKYGLQGFFIFANFSQTRSADVDTIMKPLTRKVSEIVGGSGAISVPPASFSSTLQPFIRQYQTATPDPTGFIDRLGSRLVSRDFLLSDNGPAKLSNALQAATPYSLSVIGHVVAGGQVARNGDLVDNAVNPAWRRATTHLVVSWTWGVNATLAEQAAITSGITNIWMPPLRQLEPDMGAYVNEADADEPSWQASFWGSNYERLGEIKQKWDADGLFITRRGVGSEEWDEEGLCGV